MRRRYGSVTLYRPDAPAHRVAEHDREGHLTTAIDRTATGAFTAGWVRVPGLGGEPVGIRAGGAEHPLWGPSDRIVRGRDAAEALTVAAAVDWDRLDRIPALADPTRLPAGAGTALLNLLAGLAADQGAPRLRYRGPYATEQLFWALAESFRFEAAGDDPVGRFLDGAEAALLAGTMREAPVDWAPAPHERLFLDAAPGGLYVQLRDGVEKVVWEGRPYYRTDWQGLTRREHRVVRAAPAPDGGLRFVVGLAALGRPVEDHWLLDAEGGVIDALAPPAGADEPGRETPLAPPWRAALGALLPLEASPLLATAIAAVWPAF